MKNNDFIAPIIKGKTVIISLGQDVILESYSWGNSNHQSKAHHAKVTKIGKKYLYVGEYQFDVETLHHVDKIWGPGWKLYPSQQEYDETKEKERILGYLQSYFCNNEKVETLSLAKLREIEELIHKAD